MCKNSEQRKPQSLPVQSIAEIKASRGRTKNFMITSPSEAEISVALGRALNRALEIAQTVNLLSREPFNQKLHDK